MTFLLAPAGRTVTTARRYHNDRPTMMNYGNPRHHSLKRHRCEHARRRTSHGDLFFPAFGVEQRLTARDRLEGREDAPSTVAGSHFGRMKPALFGRFIAFASCPAVLIPPANTPALAVTTASAGVLALPVMLNRS